MDVRLPYYRINKCKPTEPNLTSNRTSQCVIKKMKRVLIDAAIPGDRNVIKNEAEKIINYKDLTIEIKGT